MNVALYLRGTDPALGAFIGRVGQLESGPYRNRSPFESLVRSVAHQQLSGKAAATILGRFTALFPKGGFPTPQEVADIDIAKLTGVGFSRAKASYVKGIARSTLDGTVPGRREVERMSDDEIVERLTQVKGVGRWTVEMLLIFGLGREDVLPVHDLGIRKGFSIVYKKKRLPEPEEVLKHGERWRPYRTTASLYLWRAVDGED